MVSIANGETGLSVREKLNAAFADLDAAAGLANASTAYANRAAAVAATVPATALRIQVLTPSGHVLTYVRNTRSSDGLALSTNAATVQWMPDGNLVTPNHWAENTSEGTTDMHAAIQAAVAFVEDQGGTGTFLSGGTITLLPENYLVTSEIVVRDNGVIFQGTNLASRITNNSATASTIKFQNDTVFNGGKIETGGVYNIQMTNTATNPTAGAHIYIDRGARIVVSDCYLINHWRGVDLLGTGENCIIRGCNITQGSNTTALQAGSAGIAIRRRNVAAGVDDPAQDSGDSLWYVECNTVEITNCNIVANSFGMENCIYVDSVDGLKIVGGHTNGATNACLAFAPAQNNIGFTNVHVVGHHCDPKPATTNYGVRIWDANSAGGTTMGDIIFSGTAISGATLDGIAIAMQCTRFAFTGGSIKGSGRYHAVMNSADLDGCIISNNVMFNSDDSDGTVDAAIYALAGDGIVITDNYIDAGSRGIDINSTANVTIERNVLRRMTETPIYARASIGTGNRIGYNDIGTALQTVASATTIAPYPGIESFLITGTTTIATIRATPSSSIPNCSWDGRRIILRATSSFTVSHGTGNITLAGAANFAMAAGNRLTLEYDGATATWYELARAA